MIRRTLLVAVAMFALILSLIWLLGPRIAVDDTVRFDPGRIGPDLSAYVAEVESDVPGLTGATAREIVWATPEALARTDLAIVYIHGYSGDKRELRPVPDEVAAKLGANLFLTRLAGHGRDLAALAEPTANDWLNDTAEAIEIGRRLGDRVVLMSTSTGGTLVAWALSLGLDENVVGSVMVSPNFRLQDGRARFVNLPYAETLLPLIVGDGFELQLAEADADGNRTAIFPSRALLPMAALVDHVRGLDFGAIETPSLFVYSPQDQVVDPLATENVARRWGGPTQMLTVEDSQDPMNHMLAGDHFSPSTTGELVEAISSWIETLPSDPR